MLDALGLSAIEESVYRLLVAAPSASADDLRERLGSDPAAALERLEATGLVSRTAGRPVRYVAAPPDVAIEPLVLAQQLRLERVRAETAAIMGVYRSARESRDAGDLVEVVTGAHAIGQRFEQLQRGARHSVSAFVMPPFMTSGDSSDGSDGSDSDDEDEPFRQTELEQLARGVRYRTIYTQDGFAAQGGVEAMLADVEAGEEVRIAARVPIKLFLVDDSLAFVPMTSGDSDQQPGAVVVHPSGLLTGLVALFEQVWERASPFALANERRHAGAGLTNDRLLDVTVLDADARRLLGMLRVGFTDATMARHLGTSSRTVQRRISELMQVAGVSTRFQLGWRATTLGWID
jgi:transcriptional regulator TrmB